MHFVSHMIYSKVSSTIQAWLEVEPEKLQKPKLNLFQSGSQLTGSCSDENLNRLRSRIGCNLEGFFLFSSICEISPLHL